MPSRPSQAEIDAYLATVKCEMLGFPVTPHYSESRQCLYLRGTMQSTDPDQKVPDSFVYQRVDYLPPSLPQLKVDLLHLFAEFAAHEILEHVRDDNGVIHDSHKEGVLCVTTGPETLGYSPKSPSKSPQTRNESSHGGFRSVFGRRSAANKRRTG